MSIIGCIYIPAWGTAIVIAIAAFTLFLAVRSYVLRWKDDDSLEEEIDILPAMAIYCRNVVSVICISLLLLSFWAGTFVGAWLQSGLVAGFVVIILWPTIFLAIFTADVFVGIRKESGAKEPINM